MCRFLLHIIPVVHVYTFVMSASWLLFLPLEFES